MKKQNHFFIYLNSIILIFPFLFLSCSVFRTVGDVITQGYDNTVSYFNVYYNASRIFSEAEDEIRVSEMKAREQGETRPIANQPNQISPSAKQKFNQVIDKCSYILVFYPASSLVDNSLFLIGKSFYYQMEYLKAERKFEELIAQYPNGSLTLEAKLWNARTKDKLGKYDEAIEWCESTIQSARSKNDEEVESQTHFLLATIINKMNMAEKAIEEYEETINIATDDDLKSQAQLNLAKIYFENKKYDKAAETYLKVSEYTSDIYLNYFSNLQAAIAYRQLGEYNKGIAIINLMINDFRNKEYLPSLLYERANDYVAVGKLSEAMEEYNYVDTTYKNSEYSTLSAFQLAKLYEEQALDYESALKYYTKVNSAPKTSITEQGKSKYLAFTRYYDSRKKLVIADRLLSALKDTAKLIQTDSSFAVASDTMDEVDVDSIQLAMPKSVKKTITISPDSLNIIKSVAAQELGDIFYSEILVPDSAFYYYNQSLAWDYNPTRSPKILYILAEHSRRYPEKYSSPEEYYKQLERDFPETIYAIESRRFLGKEKISTKLDTAATIYEEAEKLIEAKQYKKAIDNLNKIAQLFPNSDYAAKSRYAIAWVYEHRLNLPESAIVHYKQVVKNYVGTMYASAASKRMFEESIIDSVKIAIPSEENAQQPMQPVNKDESKIDRNEIDNRPENKLQDKRDNRRNRNPFRNPINPNDR